MGDLASRTVRESENQALLFSVTRFTPFVTLVLGNVPVWRSEMLALLLDFNFSCRDPRKRMEPTCLPCHPASLSLGIVSKREGNQTDPSSSQNRLSSGRQWGERYVSHQELPENILSSFPLHCGSDAETEVILPTPKEILPWAEGDEIRGLGSLQRHGHIDTKCNLRPEPRSRIPKPENSESSWQ